MMQELLKVLEVRGHERLYKLCNMKGEGVLFFK